MIRHGNQPERSQLTLQELGVLLHACTYASRSGINSFTKVRRGRRPVCPCCTLTLWDFLFVTDARRRVQLWPDAVLTERWSSIVARQSLFSPHRSERTAGCTTAGNPLCDYNTQTLPVCTCFSMLNPETDQIKNQQRPKAPRWCHVSEASVRLRL